jgi:tetratricopeptide (TPR) repeat protein
VGGDDNSKYHRQLYAAWILLKHKAAVDKALEYAEAAVGNADTALAIPNAGSFVMASELYESRQLALSRSEFLQVPDVPKPTLAAILRGRIEDLIGWALVLENKAADAEIHFKRALSILPEKSAWWRASLWRYGTALQADGKEAEALDAYVRSYSIDKPDLGRYTTVEALYKKLNGSDEGLEAKIGPAPLPGADVVAKNDASAIPAALPAVTATPNIDQPQPTPTPIASAEPSKSPTSDQANTDVKSSKTEASPRTEPVDAKIISITKSSLPDDQLLPRSDVSKPDTGTKPVPESKPAPDVSTLPTAGSDTKPSSVVEPSPTPIPTPITEPSASPTPEPTLSPTHDTKPLVKSEEPSLKTEPSPSPTPVTESLPTPTPAAVAATPSSEP